VPPEGIQPADVLLVTAHPDDEVFASGTACLCAERGFRVALVCATDGEGGSGDLLFGPSRLGEIRRRELELSARALGASEVSFLALADVADPERGAWDQPGLIGALDGLIRQSAPTLILTHGPAGGYGHPSHRLLHRCVMAAAERAAFCGSIFSFCGQVDGAFFSWHFDQPSDVLIDARGFLERRAASLGYHQSQHSYFLQPRFPRTPRKVASALFGFAFAFTAAGRKRVPIGTPARFFRKFPTEGLALQRAPAAGRPHFFREHFQDDHRVRIGR
jgi:LmbE family N-acetylglucosaminyl deacetylase